MTSARTYDHVLDQVRVPTGRAETRSRRLDAAMLERAAATTLAAIAGVSILVAWDVALAARRMPHLDSARSAVLFGVFGLAFGSALAIPIALVHTTLRRAVAGGSTMAHGLLGALEGIALYALALLGQDPRALEGDVRVYLLFATVLGVGLVRVALHRLSPSLAARARASLAIGVGVTAVLACRTLRWNGYEWLRVAFDLAAVLAFVRLAGPVLARPRLVAPAATAFALVLAVSCSTDAILADSGARKVLHQRSTHVRSWAFLIDLLGDLDGDGATNLFGGTDCEPWDPSVHPRAHERPGNGRDDNCARGDAPARVAHAPRGISPLHRLAPGRDVLILSIDSFRADALDEIGPLRAALGPHVAFERAYSPAPGTKESLSATMRGVPVRSLELDSVKGVRGTVLYRDAHPTLGHVLQRAGYRTVTVPTNNVVEPRIGVTSGFESVWLANYDAVDAPAERPPQAQDYVPSPPAYQLALNAARDTPGPLCVWIHSMETHFPFHRADGSSGPKDRDGYEASLRELSTSTAAFVRDFTARRGRAPIVIVFGDHGEEFGEHGGTHHASTAYAEQVRVAFLVAAPGLEAGTRPEPVSTISVPATVLDLLGLDVPSSMEGRSALAPADPDALVVSEAATPARITTVGYTAADMRLLVDPAHRTYELFDLASDPHETQDLAAVRPDALHRLRAAAAAWDEAH